MRTILILTLIATAASAHAQTIVINPRPSAPLVTARAQRVTINITVVNAVPTESGVGDLTAGFTAANQNLYRIVDHQCDVLAPLLNGNCRLVSMTTNGNANERAGNMMPGNGPAISVTANASFEIDPKPAPTPTPSK